MNEKRKNKTLYLLDNCLLSKAVQFLELKRLFSVIKEFATLDDCISSLKTSACDILLLNLDSAGLDALKKLNENYPDISVVVHTSRNSEQLMLASFKFGAKGYLCKTDLDLTYFSVISEVLKKGYFINSNDLKTVFSKISLEEFEQPIFSLTKRELEVLLLVAKGNTNPEIAKILGISLNTVKTQVKFILEKLNAKDRAHAAALGVKHKLIEF